MTSRGPEREVEKHTPVFRAIHAVALTLMLAVLLPLPAVAHQLTVIASVKDDAVFITAKFADGSAVKAGILRTRDANDTVILEMELDGTFPIVFPVSDHGDGLIIEVNAGNGHSNCWLLTPTDLLPKPHN